MKIAIRVILLLIAAFGIFCLYSVVSLFIPRHGEAARLSDLRSAFSKAGPGIEAVFTNSLIQEFPFTGPIAWRLTFLKDPLLSLDGRVDTNALHKFVSDNAGTQFIWSGTDISGQNWSADEWPTEERYSSVTWTRIIFGTPHTNEFCAVIDGTFDIVSNRVHFLIH